MIIRHSEKDDLYQTVYQHKKCALSVTFNQFGSSPKLITVFLSLKS